MSAGRLFFSDRYGYRFYVTPQRNKKHDNQLNHTSHLLSESVLTAALAARRRSVPARPPGRNFLCGQSLKGRPILYLIEKIPPLR